MLQPTGAESQPSSHLQSKGTPRHSALAPPTWRGNSLWSTYLGKKGETTGHVLPLVLPCFIGLPGLCNIWLFTRMVKGQTWHHSCTIHDGKDSTTTAHVQAFWVGKILVYQWNRKNSGLSVKYKYVSNVVKVPKHSSWWPDMKFALVNIQHASITP